MKNMDHQMFFSSKRWKNARHTCTAKHAGMAGNAKEDKEIKLLKLSHILKKYRPKKK
jgi:hypothetical protein